MGARRGSYANKTEVAKKKRLKKRAAKRLGVGVGKLCWRNRVLVFAEPVHSSRSHRPYFGVGVPVPKEYLTPHSA